MAFGSIYREVHPVVVEAWYLRPQGRCYRITLLSTGLLRGISFLLHLNHTGALPHLATSYVLSYDVLGPCSLFLHNETASAHIFTESLFSSLSSDAVFFSS